VIAETQLLSRLQACKSPTAGVSYYHYSKKFFSVDIIWFSDYLNQLRIRELWQKTFFGPILDIFLWSMECQGRVKKTNGADGKPQTPRSA